MSLYWIKLFENAESLHNQVVSGKILLLKVRSEKICIVKSGLDFYAFSDSCPHNGASLSMGYCNEHHQVVCPLHRYPFDLQSGRSTAGMALCLKTFPLKIETNGVFIGMKVKWWEH
jgi:nitrite reductase/ring-hydroxylating ferredoxin subunit